jgi:broad specificity phosphatase PhoE
VISDAPLYFVRHAETEQDQTIPSHQWKLSLFGRKQASTLIHVPEFKTVKILFSSTQKKAHSTAIPLAKHLNIHIQNDANLEEVRGPSYYLTTREFFEYKRKSFLDLDASINNTETNRQALARFEQCIANICLHNPNKSVVFVSHGTILTLFFAKLQNFLNDGKLMYSKWEDLEFCAWGSIYKGTVTKDIFESV